MSSRSHKATLFIDEMLSAQTRFAQHWRDTGNTGTLAAAITDEKIRDDARRELMLMITDAPENIATYEWDALWHWHHAEMFKSADKQEFSEAASHKERADQIHKMLEDRKKK